MVKEVIIYECGICGRSCDTKQEVINCEIIDKEIIKAGLDKELKK